MFYLLEEFIYKVKVFFCLAAMADFDRLDFSPADPTKRKSSRRNGVSLDPPWAKTVLNS